MTILIDFDGTVATHSFPILGEDIGAVPVLKELVAKGHQLILFTMRSDMVNPVSEDGAIVPIEGDHLTQAVNWFKENEIPLYGIQTNPTQHTWTHSPKAYGQLIIDDTCFGIPLVDKLKGEGHPDWHPHHHGLVYSPRPYVDWVRVRELLISKGIL